MDGTARIQGFPAAIGLLDELKEAGSFEADIPVLFEVWRDCGVGHLSPDTDLGLLKARDTIAVGEQEWIKFNSAFS